MRLKRAGQTGALPSTAALDASSWIRVGWRLVSKEARKWHPYGFYSTTPSSRFVA
jgi:hypothetical protein